MTLTLNRHTRNVLGNVCLVEALDWAARRSKIVDSTGSTVVVSLYCEVALSGWPEGRYWLHWT